MNILYIWLVSIPIIIAIGCILAGFVSKREIEINPSFVVFIALAIAVGWPLIIPVAAILTPLVGLYYFGKWLGSII